MRWLLALTLALTLAPVPAAGVAADGCTPAGGDLHLRAADGTRLLAHRFGSGKTAVVLGHQSDGTLCQWVPYAKRLASRGYTAIVFDFRNAGGSQTVPWTATRRLGGDVAAAARAARAAGATKVFLVGASLGGSAVVSAGANVRPPVAGVVSVSGSADLADALVAAKRLRVPALYLAAKGDRDFAPDVARLAAVTHSPHEAIVLPGFEHGVQLVAASPRARALIETFLRTH
jgi:pimeloyl-ACP methyl ester carboxylesterase